MSREPGPRAATASSLAPPPSAPLHNLPLSSTALFGRETELGRALPLEQAIILALAGHEAAPTGE